jgi:hypothetical protein
MTYLRLSCQKSLVYLKLFPQLCYSNLLFRSLLLLLNRQKRVLEAMNQVLVMKLLRLLALHLVRSQAKKMVLMEVLCFRRYFLTDFQADPLVCLSFLWYFLRDSQAGQLVCLNFLDCFPPHFLTDFQSDPLICPSLLNCFPPRFLKGFQADQLVCLSFLGFLL